MGHIAQLRAYQSHERIGGWGYRGLRVSGH